jgi:hypothetical protein
VTDWTPACAFTKRFWAGCVVLLLSAMFATVTLLSANDARRLAATHVQITATVLDNRIVTSNAADDGAETHYVTYTFTRGDVVIKNERGVPEDFFDTHPVGTAWNIKVHPDHPRIHDLYAGQTRSTAWGHLLLSVLMAAFGAWFGFSNGNWAALRARIS